MRPGLIEGNSLRQQGEVSMKVLSTLCAMMLATPAIADEVADFYKGKTFTIVVAPAVMAASTTRRALRPSA